jgi:hypothetical protein
MCYAHGPRCPKHAKQILRSALKERNESEIKDARNEYYTTTEGITKLRNQGRTELADKFQQRRESLIARSKVLTEQKKQEEKGTEFNHLLKSRKSKAVIIAGTGFLAASLLTGCATDSDADYAKVCKDAKSNQRVSDDKCSDDGPNNSAYGWYFFSMMNNNNSRVPALGAPLSGGATSIPDTATSKSGVNTSGDTVSRSGFGKGGATSKSGFGAGGAKAGTSGGKAGGSSGG